MTQRKQKQLERERIKALNELLVSECKRKDANLDSIKSMLENGAVLSYKNSYPLYFATRRKNFPLVKFLIENGALEDCDNARLHISKICEFNFPENLEESFFELLDIVHSRTGDFMTLFTPYINTMAVAGRLDKLRALSKRYYLTEAEIAGVIELRVIFEIISSNHEEILAFIETKRPNWVTQTAFDRAVDSNELAVLAYMIDTHGYIEPSERAVAKAVFDGYFDVLSLLLELGYKFNRNPLFLEKACRAAYDRGTNSIAFLLVNGYEVSDLYKGRTILEHAERDNNKALIQFLELFSENKVS